MGADGQVTLDHTVMKHTARKIRRLYKDSVLAGFAGGAADGFALFTRFEAKLEEYHGNLERAAVELARDWRTDRALRRLEALLLVASDRKSFLLSAPAISSSRTTGWWRSARAARARWPRRGPWRAGPRWAPATSSSRP